MADFSTANIFNAMNGKPAVQPLQVKQTNFINGNHTNGFDKLVNGNGKNDSNGFSNGFTNGFSNGFSNGFTTSATNGGTGENFADFEHNTIYNAAGKN